MLFSTLFTNTLSLSFTPIQNNRQIYRSVYLDLYIFGYQTRGQKILHRMITNITIKVTGAKWGGLEYRFYLNQDNDRCMAVVKMIN